MHARACWACWDPVSPDSNPFVQFIFKDLQLLALFLDRRTTRSAGNSSSPERAVVETLRVVSHCSADPEKSDAEVS